MTCDEVGMEFIVRYPLLMNVELYLCVYRMVCETAADHERGIFNFYF